MKRFILVLLPALLLIGCGKSDKEYLQAAEEQMKNDQPSAALENYEKIVTEFPDSDVRDKAIFEIARLYNAQLVEGIEAQDSFKEAIAYFKQLLDEYPDSEFAPKSLFTIGFIQNNELQDYESATETYNTFLAEYPDHELAESARVELQIMGMSPEEVLQKKLAAEDEGN